MPLIDLNFVPATFVDATDMVYEPLKNGSVLDMGVDGSITPVEYKYTVPSGKHFHLRHMHWLITDVGLTNFDQWGGAGKLSDADSPLIEIVDTDGTTVLQDFGTSVIYLNNIGRLSFLNNGELVLHAGSPEDIVSFHWAIYEDPGQPLCLIGGQSVRITIRGDMSLVDEILVQVQGRYA